MEISAIALDEGSINTLETVADYAVPANYRLYQRVPVGEDGSSNCATVISVSYTHLDVYKRQL